MFSICCRMLSQRFSQTVLVTQTQWLQVSVWKSLLSVLQSSTPYSCLFQTKLAQDRCNKRNTQQALLRDPPQTHHHHSPSVHFALSWWRIEHLQFIKKIFPLEPWKILKNNPIPSHYAGWLMLVDRFSYYGSSQTHNISGTSSISPISTSHNQPLQVFWMATCSTFRHHDLRLSAS